VEQVVDYKGLAGDTSDNIPGVRGIGDKGAIDLLTRFGTLEGIYEHINDENIKDGVRNKLLEQKDLAFLSRTLGTIKTDLAIDCDFSQARSKNFSYEGARTIFAKCGFKSLIKRLPQQHSTPKEKIHKDVRVIEESEDWDALLRGKDVSITLDTEGGTLHGVAFATRTKTFYLPYNTQTKESLGRFLRDTKMQCIVFDAKAFLHACDRYALPHPTKIMDTLLQAYVLHTGQKLTFEQLVFDVTGETYDDDVLENQQTLDLRDTTRAIQKSAQIAEDIYAMYRAFNKDIAKTIATQNNDANIKTLLEDIELPTVFVLYDMEVCGIGFDTTVFEKIARNTDAILTKLATDIHAIAGSDFNINSTQQLRVVLFETLALPTDGIKKTKTGYSTAASELEKLRDTHPIIAKIEHYRELFKLKTTYIDTLPKLVAPDGRIHTTFNQVVTSTGRLSSSDPNLQNIPVRTETGRALREAFVAEKGRVLISADYSQIDLRCVAHVANDKEMIKAFKDGADIHTYTAASVLSKPMAEITKSERSSAKELNFGLIYGMGVRSFAKSAGISTTEAKAFVDAYFKKFHGIKKYMEQTKKEAKEKGYVETLLGRRKYTPELQSSNGMLRAAGERAAINMPIQGLTADIMKLAMIALREQIKTHYKGQDVKIVLQVHDEIILEVPTAIAKDVARDVKDRMEQVYTLRVPLVVDTAIGAHWGEL